MIELKQYIDNIVLNSNMFFSVAVPIMREINTNIRRLSAHTTIMTYEELVNTRQRILGIGYLNLFESKQKAQKREIIHGFIGCRCTEWYRG